MDLLVSIPGRAPYQARRKEFVPLILLGRLSSGPPLPVKVDPADPQRTRHRLGRVRDGSRCRVVARKRPPAADRSGRDARPGPGRAGRERPAGRRAVRLGGAGRLHASTSCGRSSGPPASMAPRRSTSSPTPARSSATSGCSRWRSRSTSRAGRTSICRRRPRWSRSPPPRTSRSGGRSRSRSPATTRTSSCSSGRSWRPTARRTMI